MYFTVALFFIACGAVLLLFSIAFDYDRFYTGHRFCMRLVPYCLALSAFSFFLGVGNHLYKLGL